MDSEDDWANGTQSNCTLPICNASATTEPYLPHTERLEFYLVPIVFAAIFLVGVAGNGFLVYLFFRYPQMRNQPNTYILSLAVGDLLVIVFGVPFVSVIYTTRSWPFGEIVCGLQQAVGDVSVSVTVITLTALSAERYFAIVHPVNRRSMHSQSALLVTVFIWVVSFSFAVPAAFFSEVRYFPTSDGGHIAVCSPFPAWLGEFYPKVVVLTKMLLLYAVPLAIISVFYCLMSRHLISSAAALPGEGIHHPHRAAQINARRKVAKMVLAFVCIFAICFLPNHVFLMWFYFHPTAKNDFNYFWNVFRIVGFCLSFINSCINPVALYCISGTFRKYYNHHLFCGICDSATIQGGSFSNIRLHSSGAVLISSRTDHFDMSAMNNVDKVRF